jgi:hypothetical protein
MEARHNPKLVPIIARLWPGGLGGTTAGHVQQRLWLGRQGTISLVDHSPSVNGPQGPFGPKKFFYISIVLDFFH